MPGPGKKTPLPLDPALPPALSSRGTSDRVLALFVGNRGQSRFMVLFFVELSTRKVEIAGIAVAQNRARADI
jgi:hypothetical protein